MRFTVIDHTRLIYGQRFEFILGEGVRGVGPLYKSNEVSRWCVAEFGRRHRNELKARWWPTDRRIWIRDEQDATVFRLRWC